MHFFLQITPDILYELEKNIKIASPNDLIHYNPKLTSNIFELIKIGQEIGYLLGGRHIHPITTTIGGHFYNPTKNDLQEIKK